MMRANLLKLFVFAVGALSFACGGGGETVTRPGPGLQALPPEAPVAMLVRPSKDVGVSIEVVIRAGSAYDPPGKAGLGWLVGHLSAEGGTADLAYADLLDRLHPWAAQLSVQVDKEQLTFTGRCHADHAKDFVPLFLDVVLRPRLAQADFDRLRKQALEQLTREVRTSNDEELVKLVLEAALFEGHPLSHPSLGTEAGLNAITLDDLKAHRATLFARDRITVGLAGAVSPHLAAEVAAALGDLPASSPVPVALPGPPAHGPRLIVVNQPSAPATAISVGHPVSVRRGHADFPALAAVASHFGEHRQFRGVLFQRIREARGMNYGDYAYAEAFVQAGWGRFPRMHLARSHQFFSLWVRPVPNEDALFAARIVRWHFDALLRDGLSADEVAATAAYLTGYEALKRQTPLRRLGDAIDARFYGVADDDYPNWLRAGLKALTADSTNAALRTHLKPAQSTVVVVTPDAEAFVKAVLANTPSPKKYAAPKPADVVAEDEKIAVYPLGFTADQVRIVQAADFAK